jgi:hypothetical protein
LAFLLCRKLGEEELKMNVADQDVFTFPSESELKEPLGLQEVQRRIRDLVAVLSDFNKLRDKNRYAAFPSECTKLTLTHSSAY